MKFIKLGYSVITYLFFLAVFNYLVLFLGAGFFSRMDSRSIDGQDR